MGLAPRRGGRFAGAIARLLATLSAALLDQDAECGGICVPLLEWTAAHENRPQLRGDWTPDRRRGRKPPAFHVEFAVVGARPAAPSAARNQGSARMATWQRLDLGRERRGEGG